MGYWKGIITGGESMPKNLTGCSKLFGPINEE